MNAQGIERSEMIITPFAYLRISGRAADLSRDEPECNSMF